MKEYRIKATSAEHRKAIIGALEALGVEDHYDVAGMGDEQDEKDNTVGYFNLVGIADGYLNTWRECNEYPATHTSLDTLIADIISDRQAVEIDMGQWPGRVKVTGDGVSFDGIHSFIIGNEDFDRIAEAVKKVRGQ